MLTLMADHTEFRWGIAVLHAVLALVVTVAVTGAMAVLFDVADPRRFGEGVGRLCVFMMFGAFGVSWLFQTGRRVAAMIVGGLLGTLLAVLVVVTAMAVADRPPRSQRLPAVDLVRADGMLRHPTLGFAIPDPGPSFSPQPELAAARLPSSRHSRGWVYADLTSSESVIIMLDSGGATDAKTFEDFFRGVLRGQTRAMNDAAVTSEEQERWVRWPQRRAHATIVIAEEIYLRVDAFGLTGGEALVMVSTSPDRTRFEGLAAQVETDPP